MTYLDRLKEVEQRISLHRVGIAECEQEYSEIILDMANHIENLEDDLRKYKEEDWNKRAYGD